MEDALLVDAGTGNLHSVYNALTFLGYSISIITEPGQLARSGRVVLPGVGAFGKFMAGLEERGLCEPVQLAIQRGDPVLGICVGMQALFDYSEEMGKYPGLGLMAGKVTRFPEMAELKVPQTGWNQVLPTGDCALLKGIPVGSYAYFNHSYYCEPANAEDVAASTDYGISFASIVQRQSLVAVQFHPEKSQQVGLQLLKNFMEM
jgi:glutamine amidotransferase